MKSLLQDVIQYKVSTDINVRKHLNKYSNKTLESMLKEINQQVLDKEEEIAKLLGLATAVEMTILTENRPRTKWQKFWYGK